MRVALIVCLLMAVAHAAPKHTRSTTLDPSLAPQVRTAEQAWADADREKDPAKQAALWQKAALAFAEIDAASVGIDVKREAARVAILAWQNAFALDTRVRRTSSIDASATPRAIPADEQSMIAAFDRYLKYADAAAPDLADVLFLKARVFARHDHLEAAIPIYRTILDHHRHRDVAEHAAHLLLDTYNRLRQHDKLVALADELASDAALMKRAVALAEVVYEIQAQAKRKDAERLEAAARAANDPDMYARAGRAYLALYNADPRSSQADELLYNAAVCLESGAAIGEAIQVYSSLQRRHPTSKLAARALARLAALYARIAQYEHAAEKLEEYATKYAGEKNARDALRDAIYYRNALGQRDKAIASTRQFLRLFGAKSSREAAEAFWSLAEPDEEQPDRALAHLREYLRTYAAHGSRARVVVAHVKIGQILARQSCPHPLLDGLCVKLAPMQSACSRSNSGQVTATPRDARLHQAAIAELERAIAGFEALGRDSGDAVARHAYAQAKLALADAELEAFLAIQLPPGLDLQASDAAVRARSSKQLHDWIERKSKLADAVSRAYEATAAIDSHVAVTAAARVGTGAHAFAASIVAAPLPRSIRGRDNARDAAKVRAFCTTLTEEAEPLLARAVEAYETCLTRAQDARSFEGSWAHCERELTRAKPDEFPPTIELRASALGVAPVIALEPPLRP